MSFWSPFVTISAVTHEFGVYREPLRKHLTRPHLAALIQEDFGPSTKPLLDKLDEYIRSSSCVIHLVGEMVGIEPDEADVATFLTQRPEFAHRVPYFKQLRDGELRLSYTQWEAVLARCYRRALAVFRPTADAVRDPRFHASDEDRRAQTAHLERISSMIPPTPFSDVQELQVRISEYHEFDRIFHPVSFPDFEKSRRLKLPEAKVEAKQESNIFEKRCDVLGMAPAWDIVCRNRYFVRRKLLAAIAERFDVWRTSESAKEFAVPVFWLDGRSGDGKSVLLLQVAADFLQREPGFVVTRVNKPTDLLAALQELRASEGNALIVVDDLFRARNDAEAFFSDFNLAFEDGLPVVPILTCGPTEELEEFKILARAGRRFDVTSFEVPCPSFDELREIAAWLGKVWQTPQASDKDPLLIEELFELDVGEPLAQFAINFRQRLENSEDAAFVDKVTSILLVNGLDLPASAELLGNGRGRQFVSKQLGWAKHFKLDEKLQNNSPAIRFSHTRIAWRLFEAWTQDGPLGLPIADYLLPVFALESTWCENDFEALAGALMTRLPLLGGAEAPLKVLQKLLPKLNSKAQESILLERYMQSVVRGRLKKESDLLVERSRALAADSDVPIRRRRGLYRYLVIEAAQTGEIDSALEAEAKAVVFADEAIQNGASNLMALANYQALSSRQGWMSWPQQWLESHGAEPEAASVHSWVVKHVGGAREAVEAALDWTDAYPEHRYCSTVLSSLLAHARYRRFDVRDRALRWLESDLGRSGARNLLEALLSPNASSAERIIPLTIAWLDQSSATTPGYGQVLHRALEKLDTEPIEAKIQTDVVDHALAWVRENPGLRGAPDVIRKLLVVDGTPSDFVDEAMDWYDTNRDTKGRHEVLSALLTATACRPTVLQRALISIDASPTSSSNADILTAILSASNYDDDVLSAVQERIVAYTEMPARHHVFSFLLNSRCQGVVDLVLTTLKSCMPAPSWSETLSRLLDEAGDRADVAEAAITWLQSNYRTRDVAHVLDSLILKSGHLPEVRGTARAWLDDNPHHRRRRVILADLLLAEWKHGSTDPLAIGNILEFITTRDREAEKVLGRWLRLDGAYGVAVDSILACKQRADRTRDRELFLLIARVSARNAEIILAAAGAKADLSVGADLCYLVEQGLRDQPGLPAELLELRAIWPERRIPRLWQAVIKTRVAPESYIEAFAEWIDTRPPQGLAVLDDFSRKADLAATVIMRLPDWARRHVATKRGNRLLT